MRRGQCTGPVRPVHHPTDWGERGDLNPRPPGPQPGALTELSYAHHGTDQSATGRPDRHNTVRQRAATAGGSVRRPHRGASGGAQREVITDDRHRIRLTEWPSTRGPPAGSSSEPRRSPSVSSPATRERTAGSQAATDRARKVLPLGVPSSFQAYDPHPIVVRHAVRRRTWSTSTATTTSTTTWASAPCSPATCTRPCGPPSQAQLDDGTLYVTPCELERRGRRAARRPLRPADVALHQLRHRGDDGRHPRRQGRRPAGTRSSRSRAATTATTTR